MTDLRMRPTAAASALADRIYDLATRLDRDVEALTREITASCPGGGETNPFIGYLETAAKLLAIAASETGDGRLYLPSEEASEIDRIIAEMRSAS